MVDSPAVDLTEGAYEANDPVYARRRPGEPKEMFKAVLAAVAGAVGDRPVSLLDVGCASGDFLEAARTRLPTTARVGVDISDEHLALARQADPEAEFVLGSIWALDELDRTFDVVTCIGTLSVFDDLERAVRNLAGRVTDGGVLVVLDIVNEHPVDVLVRFRRADEEGPWRSAYNVRSQLTYEAIVGRIDPAAAVEWTDFRMPFPIEATDDPLRSWTAPVGHEPHAVLVGTGQLLDFKIAVVRFGQRDRRSWS